MANDISAIRGIDAARADRPGVPKERQPPEPLANAHWLAPDRQANTVKGKTVTVLMHADRNELTPVFSTQVPPRGLSGLIRRAAYRIPDNYVKHWLLLLVADRVDAHEHRLARMAPLAALVGAAAAATLVVRGVRR